MNKIKSFAKLSYYATFKVRKSESLFYKINTCLQKTTTCIGLRADEIFSVNILYIIQIYNICILQIFFDFRRGFCGSFPVLFSKAPASCF